MKKRCEEDGCNNAAVEPSGLCAKCEALAKQDEKKDREAEFSKTLLRSLRQGKYDGLFEALATIRRTA